jgi:putative transposase
LVRRAVVHPASVADRDGAMVVLRDLTTDVPDVTTVWVDMGYRGRLVAWAEQTLELTRTVVTGPRRWARVAADHDPPPLPNPMPVLPRRWVVERTFAWLDRYRRLSKDYEHLAATEETRIYAAMFNS